MIKTLLLKCKLVCKNDKMNEIHIGKLIREACLALQITDERMENFFSMPYAEVENMFAQEHLSTDLLLKWSKLLKFDFFRIYSGHLMMYHGISAKLLKEKTEICAGLDVRKNLYTPEIKNFIVNKVQTNQITIPEAIEKYGVGRTTLFRWIAKVKKQEEAKS
jgi:hypothetical protein